MSTRVWHHNDKTKPLDAKYIARAFAGNEASIYGNPFPIGENRTRAVAAYAEWFHADTPKAEARRDAAVLDLTGYDLVCWCAPDGGVTAADLPWVCHGQVLAEFLDQEQADIRAAAASREIEPPDDLLWQAREALRLTREYIEPACVLPGLPGWSWYDAVVAIDEYLGLPRADWLDRWDRGPFGPAHDQTDTVTAHAASNPTAVGHVPADTGFTFAEFRTRGFLWLLNTTALHPRGYALALAWPDGTGIEGIDAGAEPTGWTIMGDGSEPWTMGDPPDRPGYLDSLFDAVEATLADARARNTPSPEVLAAPFSAPLGKVEYDLDVPFSDHPSHVEYANTPAALELPLEPVGPGPKHGPARVDERRLRSTTNASVWVEEFRKVMPDADEGLMLGWFANAIEHGRDAGHAAALRNPTCDDLDAPAPPVDHSQHPYEA